LRWRAVWLAVVRGMNGAEVANMEPQFTAHLTYALSDRVVRGFTST
jgi:hypothetical protein